MTDDKCRVGVCAIHWRRNNVRRDKEDPDRRRTIVYPNTTHHPMREQVDIM